MEQERRRARRFLKEAVLLLPRLLRLLYRLMRDPRVRRADRFMVAAAVAYVVTPVDLIPDFIPFVGQLDDLFAVTLVLLRLIANAGEELIQEHWSGPEDLVPWIHRTARYSEIFLPPRVTQAIRNRFGRS